MREKAVSSYRAAVMLTDAGLYNDAASRGYYALYQTLVYAWEEEGFQPEDVDRVASDAKNDGEVPKWRHSFVRKNLGRWKLTRQQECLVLTLWELRRKADYYVDPVPAAVKHSVAAIPAFLKAVKGIEV